MNFELSEHHQMLQATIARYLADQYPMSRRLAGAATESGFDSQAWTEFGEQGFIGAVCSESVGGFGGSGLDLLVVFQELGRALVVEPFLSNGVLVGSALAAVGNHEERFASVLAGEAVASLGLVMPDARYEVGANAVTAASSDTGWRLSGQQPMVAFGDTAQWLLTFAEIEGGDSLGLFLCSGDNDGLKKKGFPLMDGGRAANLQFDGVDAECLLQGDQAKEVLQEVLARGRVALCAEALGCMEKACEMTLEYLRDRKQFGQPIGTFQALRHRIVDVLVEVDQAKSLVISAANRLDSQPKERDLAVAAAKYHVGQTGQLVAEECVQLHGGIGMTWEYPLGHYAKRLVMIDHQLGDSDYHLREFARLSNQDVA
ncbi:MAG: acyl-CoA dehydrogenase family protein [Pseudomonadota bacterium]